MLNHGSSLNGNAQTPNAKDQKGVSVVNLGKKNQPVGSENNKDSGSPEQKNQIKVIIQKGGQGIRENTLMDHNQILAYDGSYDMEQSPVLKKAWKNLLSQKPPQNSANADLRGRRGQSSQQQSNNNPAFMTL